MALLKTQKSQLQTVLPNPRKESFVMLLCGRRGSGKTTLATRLLVTANAFKNKFDKIVIISPTFYLSPQWRSFDSSNWSIYTKYNPQIIEELLQDQSTSSMWRLKRERPKILLILDDLGKTSRQIKKNDHDPLDTLSCNGRHLDISVMFLGQQFSQMNTALRSNADIIIFFASHNLRDNLDLYNEVGTGDYKTFRDRIAEVTNERYNFLLVKNCGGVLKYSYVQLP
jgi:Cdc6-like AAA superfamily ATPase